MHHFSYSLATGDFKLEIELEHACHLSTQSQRYILNTVSDRQMELAVWIRVFLWYSVPA